ncbi:terminal uridylyltransferase 4-like [Asterias rubens]|uniref:terminal uridylyltransferase 4-like n=1 Tax=Asterias rubens TaxID=7604 RepID=UPI001455A451|nr:terminal uridylyltransferase 4-like [Asterias rubens]
MEGPFTMEESCSPTNNPNQNKTQKMNINGNKRQKQTSNQVSTTYSQRQEHVIGGTRQKVDFASSHPQLEGSQKLNNKRTKEKQKAKELARYQRKIQKNPEMADIVVVEKHVTHQNTVDTLKEVDQHQQVLQDETLDLDKTKKQSKAQARDDEGESSNKKMHSDKLHHVPDAHTNKEDLLVEEHYIYRLNKKSPRFPHAKFYCRLCNYHLDNLTLCKKHWKEPRHSKLEESKSYQWEIKKIKAPNKAHAGALSTLLKSVVDENALNKGDLEMRQRIAHTVEKILHKEMPDVTVSVYGSSLSGFGFKDSDVNLSIEAPEGSIPSQVLVMACQALGPGDEIFEDIESDFEGRFPCIRFSDKQSGLKCELCTGSVSAIKTSQLLRDYRQIDPRVHLLAMALRSWARLCGVDSQSDGSMPAYSFVLMTIYFLQHCQPPVVPVLQENEKLEGTNTDSLGELWIKMLKFYTFDIAIEEIVISVRKREPVSRDELKIPNRRLAIEDPIAVNKKNIAKSLSSNIVFQYVFDRLQEALLYFGQPQKATSKPTDPKQPHSDGIDAKDSSYKTSSGVHTSRSVKGTGRDLSTNIIESLTGSGDVRQELSVDSHSTDLSTDADVLGNKECTVSVASTVNVSTSDDSEISQSIAEQNLVDSNDLCHANACVENDTLHVDASLEVTELLDSLDVSKPTGDTATNQDFHFVFDEKVLTGGKKVMVVCNGCAKEGHRISECPDESVPNLVVLPAMDRHYLKRIDALCKNIADTFCLKDWDMKRRNEAVENYEWFIQNNGYQDARLQLFGSSRNGFGFTKSDMDICLKFQHHQTAEELDIPVIVEDLAKKLKKHKNLHNIIPISTAKVPIVKFVDRCMQLDADISLYNCLAQANTRMLHAYAMIDVRVRQLVYTVKVFAKVCDIGDASKGSLSSYAYTLMMIFFLQQRTPSVLPVLQELYQGKEKPKDVVEGRNAWYLTDMHKLPQFWRRSNTESVGELWLGFLRFFTEEFNSKKHVVCTRQHKPLTRFEKMWTGAARGFAIEDPFDLDHNLGGGVSRKMATFIMQVFINAREHFGSPKNIGRFLDDFEFFLDAYSLTGGEAPPNDRCCRVCGKIGHFLKDCPHRKGKKDINKGRDRDREDAKKRGDRGKNDVKPLEDSQQTHQRSNAPHTPIQSRVYTATQPTQGANGKVKPTNPPTGRQQPQQQTPAKSHIGTMQQTTAKPHIGTMQQTVTAKPPVRTMQPTLAKTSAGTMHQTQAKSSAGNMHQTKTSSETVHQAPAKTSARAMQQAATSKPQVGTMQQTPTQVTLAQTKSATSQQKNIDESWRQHQVERKHNKKHDQRQGKRSQNTNKNSSNRPSEEQSAKGQSVNGTYNQAYPALPTTMDQPQYGHQQQPAQQQPLQRPRERNPDQRLHQYTESQQPAQVQTYFSSSNATARPVHNVEHNVQQQPLQRHKQQTVKQLNDGHRSRSDKQMDSGSQQHWGSMQQQHHQMQQQVTPPMQPQQLNNMQVDQHTAKGFDISKLASALQFHNQPVPTNEKPLQVHELEAMQMRHQQKHPHPQKEHLQNQHVQNQQQMLQHQNQGPFPQQQEKPYQPQQQQQQKQFSQQQHQQEQRLSQPMIQQQLNLQYPEQWNQTTQQFQALPHQHQQHQQHHQQQQQQHQQHHHQQQQQQNIPPQQVNRIQSSQSLSSSQSSLPSSTPLPSQGPSLGVYTFGGDGGLWNQPSGVPNSRNDAPVHPLSWPSGQQYPNYPSEESNIGAALLQGVSFLQSGTGQNDMQHMTSMHRMGSDTASSESTIPQHVNQHGSIQQ